MCFCKIKRLREIHTQTTGRCREKQEDKGRKNSEKRSQEEKGRQNTVKRKIKKDKGRQTP